MQFHILIRSRVMTSPYRSFSDDNIEGSTEYLFVISMQKEPHCHTKNAKCDLNIVGLIEDR